MLLTMSMEEKRKVVLKGNLFKGLLILSIPIIINNLLQTMYNVVDTYWVSQISNTDNEVAAVGGVWPINFFIIAFGIGLQIAGTSLMSQNIGAGRNDRANYIASQLYVFALIVGVIMAILGYTFSPLIIKFMGFEGEIYELGLSYLRIIFFETPILFSFLIFMSMRQSQGDTLTPVLFSASSVIINIILDPIFILQFNMGVQGVALATVLSKVIVMPFALLVLFKAKKSVHIVPKYMKLKFKTIKRITSVALPASVGTAFSSLGFIFLNGAIIGLYGKETMAAFTVGNRFISLIMMPAMGFGNALAFYVGQNIGANQTERAKASFRTSITLTLSFMFVGMLILLPYNTRSFAVNIFLKEKRTIELAMTYMLFIALNVPLMGLFANFNGVFQGSGKTWFVLIMNATRLWIFRLPVIYLLYHITDLGPTGVWYAMVLSNVIICIIGTFLYKFGHWERKIIKNDHEDEEMDREMALAK
ncbi:MATE family efflux transporter [Haloplasma contractile]|uniref:Sodium-driven multidrug efflux pump protein n=1 Tax=Haloplasma contractile SSD-17B TaxID=1033810 RepID=U2DSU4_9MOLU|nr:MATE family efflux transporter [Haloplasma contractile]ERJ11562.1 Sodium-driven multidrug efflux pump protein [Haloplasma contractile SSD-17B]